MRRRLALLNVATYLVAVLVGGFLTVPALRQALLFLREPVALLPGLAGSLVQVVLLASLVLVAGLATGRALASERPIRGLSLLVWLLLGTLMIQPALLPQTRADIHPASARAETIAAMRRIAKALEAYRKSAGRYPEDASALAIRFSNASPWVGHGHRLPWRIRSERGLGPRLRGQAGDLAGTIYYVVSPTHDDYWLTGVLLSGVPTGVLDFVRDEKGRPFILSSRPSSIRDDSSPLPLGAR